LTTYMAGWPAISYTRVEFESDDTSHNFARWHWKGLLLNSVVALGILAASAWIFERIIYRPKNSELRAS